MNGTTNGWQRVGNMTGWVVGSLVASFLGIFLLEGFLRGLGFGNPPVYIADPTIGYLLQPNQRIRRFGRRIWINRYSMRSEEIQDRRSPHTLRILLLGDSVANGGWWTDQADTIATLLQERLQAEIAPLPHQETAAPPTVEVLNASANSWGPRNELAYLQRFGLFEAQVVVLLLNTDDLFATAPTSLPVGRDRNYPDRKPPLALVELASRMRPAKPRWTAPVEKGDRVGANLAALEQIHRLVVEGGGRFIIAMTPLRRELGEGSRDYEQKARERLQVVAEHHQIAYLDLLPQFQQTEWDGLYRDHIHPSPEGNRVVSEAIATLLRPVLPLTESL